MKIGFIGGGNVGKALGLYLKSHELSISGYYSRTQKSSKEAAILTNSREHITLKSLAESSDIIFIAVPDQALKDIDCKVAAMIHEYPMYCKITWIHVSGAHSSDCLCEIKRTGCDVGSLHPLQSFGEAKSSAKRLSRTWFTIEGTKMAVHTMKKLLDKTEGNYSLIDAENKPLYHVGACIISNFLVTLLESGINCFEKVGMERKHILQAIEPLIEATLHNIRKKGTLDAITGPIVRGDINTILVHLCTLGERLPSEIDFYRTMAFKTVLMLEGNRLTHKQVNKFQEILEEKS